MPSFRVQLAAAFTLAALLPVVAMGAIAFTVGDDVGSNALQDAKDELANALAGSVAMFVAGIHTEIEDQSRLPGVVEAFRAGDEEALARSVTWVGHASESCGDVYYVLPDGGIAAASFSPHAVGASLAGTPAIDGALAGTPRTLAAPPAWLRADGAAFVAAVPVVASDGAIVGAVACIGEAARFTRAFAAEIDLARDEDELAITDETGLVVLAESHAQGSSGPVPPSEGGSGLAGASAASWQFALGEDLSEFPPVSRGLASSYGPERATLAGEEFLVTTAPAPGLPWVVVSASSLEVAFAPVRAFQLVMGLFAGVVAIAVVGAATYYGSRAARPLATVERAVGQLAARDYATRLPETGAREFASLARSINTMSAKLEEQRRELEDHARALEATVEARTRDLAEEKARLVEANARLAETDRFKSAFLANMSHELRTPLNAIIGYTELTKEGTFGPVNEKQEKRLGSVLESARHLLGLINDVLDISKVASGKMDMHVEAVDVEALLEEAREIAAPLATKRGVELVLEGAAVDVVHADRIRLKQCLLNYMSNAVKFTPAGGRVTLRVTREGEEAEFAVVDTGPGISDEDQAKLFREFTQLDNSMTRKHGGTGLGLALTRKLAELQAGTAGVRSKVGEGSVFWLRVPLGRPEARRCEPEAPRGGPLPILVVDDEPAVRSALKRALESKGHSAITAGAGDEAIAILAETPVAGVILDVVMPGALDGWEVLRRMRASPATADVPVVFLSRAQGEDLALALGASAFLAKPLEFEAVVASIDEAIRARRGRVLVADDEPGVLEALHAALSTRGFAVETVTSGAEALAAARRETPGAIILDLCMPDLDGFEVAKRLKEDPALARVPVFVLTAKDLTDAERRFLLDSVRAIYAKGDGAVDELARELKRLPFAVQGALTA